jgi:hypothetical protein
MVPDTSLLARAADCYFRAGSPYDAARCYRAAGAHRAAAQTWETLLVFPEAARDYAAAGAHEQAAWILVHHLGDVPAALDELAAAARAAGSEAQTDPAGAARPPVAAQRAAELRRRLILARCNVAGDAALAETLAILGEVMAYAEHDAQSLLEPGIERLAVAVAESMNRPDLVALVFAAAVRGGHHQAVERWDEWSRRVLGVPLVLPAPGTDPALEHDAAVPGQAGTRPSPG